MAFGARILADSLSPDGVRLTTFEVTHPRPILAEVNTHRMLSKNSASSRAIPVATLLKRVQDDPYVPIYWGANKKGMQAAEELDEERKKLCLDEWLAARDDAMRHADKLRELGLHKQDANRILEPFMWHTALLSGTEWDNFFHLRNHPDAHPAFQTVAAMMQELYEELEPSPLGYDTWHTPLLDAEAAYDALNRGTPVSETLVKISTGRSARVSTLTHDGKRDLSADIQLHDGLFEKGHMSPFEHCARPAHPNDCELDTCTVRLKDVRYDNQHDVSVDPDQMWFGNFRGWVQYRKLLPNEHDPLGAR